MSLKINITQQELLEMRAFTTKELRLKAMEILKSIGVPLSEPNIVDMVNGLIAKIQKHKAGAVLSETQSNKQYIMKKSQLQQIIREEVDLAMAEQANPEMDRLVKSFIEGIAMRNQYSNRDALYAVFEALKRLRMLDNSVDYKAPAGM